MKKPSIKTTRTLRLNPETIRTLTVLSDKELEAAAGGQNHTSFSCGNNLCTTH